MQITITGGAGVLGRNLIDRLTGLGHHVTSLDLTAMPETPGCRQIIGDIRDESRTEYLRIIDGLQARGAQGIILGCTEIPLLVKPADVKLPMFDTTVLHAEAALAYALAE